MVVVASCGGASGSVGAPDGSTTSTELQSVVSSMDDATCSSSGPGSTAETDATTDLIVQCSSCSLELPWDVLRLGDGRCAACIEARGSPQSNQAAEVTNNASIVDIGDKTREAASASSAAPRSWRAARRQAREAS